MESTTQGISNAPTTVQDKNQRLWTCEVCNHSMGEGSQQSHLAGKKHKAKAQNIEQQSSDENFSPKTGAPAREIITDPVKLSYLRMKQQMELYGGYTTKTTATNIRTPRGKEGSGNDTRAVYPETVLHGEMCEGDENSKSTTTDIPLPKKSRLVLQLRKKPGLHNAPLTDQDIPSTPPAAALVSLKAARRVQDFGGLSYPADILSPGLSQHSAGNFKYDKDFLMQFKNVFTEKPLNWDKKIHGLFGDEAPLPEAARAALGLTTLLSTMIRYRGSRTKSGAGQLPLNMLTPLQRLQPPRAGLRPETGTNASSGADITRKDPENSLKGPEPNKSRSGKSPSWGNWKNGEKTIDGVGTEPEQGDIPNPVLPTAGFRSPPKNNSSEREITPIPDNPPYTAHIGNLNFDIEVQGISDFFSECDVKTVTLVRDKLNDRPKGFGYVEFNTKVGLIAAIELNGGKVCGRNIRVSIPRPPKTTKADQGPAVGGWRDASTNLESLVNQTPIVELSAMTRALEESVGIRRLGVVKEPQVTDRIGRWRNPTLEKKPPPTEITPKWDCVSCGISIPLDKKDIHLLRHSTRLKKHQQQRLGSNSKGEQRRSSPIRGETAEEGDIDIWGGKPSDETFSNYDWES